MGNSACCTGAEAQQMSPFRNLFQASADHEQKELTRKEAAPGVANLPGRERPRRLSVP